MERNIKIRMNSFQQFLKSSEFKAQDLAFTAMFYFTMKTNWNFCFGSRKVCIYCNLNNIIYWYGIVNLHKTYLNFVCYQTTYNSSRSK